MIGVVLGIVLFVFVGLPLIAFLIVVVAAAIFGRKIIHEVEGVCKFYPYHLKKTSKGFQCSCPGQLSLFGACHVSEPTFCSDGYRDSVTNQCIPGHVLVNNPLPALRLYASILSDMQTSPYNTVAYFSNGNSNVGFNKITVSPPKLYFTNPSDAMTKQGRYWSGYFDKVAQAWASQASRVLTARWKTPSQLAAWEDEYCKQSGICHLPDSAYRLDKIQMPEGWDVTAPHPAIKKTQTPSAFPPSTKTSDKLPAASKDFHFHTTL